MKARKAPGKASKRSTKAPKREAAPAREAKPLAKTSPPKKRIGGIRADETLATPGSMGQPLSAEEQALPLVALVGRPNVGKSSLFNRLVGGRPALVEDEPGVTRDRRYGTVNWNGARLRVVDTGGLDPSAEGILGAMRSQTLRAVDEADVLLLVIDAVAGVTGLDQEVGRTLRRTGKPVLVGANKVDTDRRDAMASEAHALGFPQMFPISAAHGRGVSDLMEAVLGHLSDRIAPALPEPKPKRRRKAARHDPPDEAPKAVDAIADLGSDSEDLRIDLEALHEVQASADPDPRRPIRLALVGKPNVGKSSLVNRLLGEERVLVHDQPGTTRDPIDSPFTYGGQDFVLVDTAGLRRRKVVKTLTEAVSAKMSRDQIERADVVALVVDLAAGASDEDAKLANFVEEAGRALVVVLNKSDAVPRAQTDAKIKQCKERLSFVSWASFVVTSAMTGRAVTEIMRASQSAFGAWSRRVPTSELNRNFEEMIARRPPPSGPSGRHIRLYYCTQARVAPPVFFVSANLAEAVGQPYRRYLANQFRKIYGFEGSPLKVVVRGRRTPEDEPGPPGPRRKR